MNSRKQRGFAIVAKYRAENPPLPKRQTALSAGYDLAAAEMVTIMPGEVALVPTPFKAYMPNGEVLKLYARSSLAVKKKLTLPNAVGSIDADYVDNPANEGQIFVALLNFGATATTIEKGERIAQGIFEKFLTVDDDEIGMGGQRSGGFGSTGENEP